MAKRKRYSAEFKRNVLRRADEPGVSAALVYQELGISTRQMRRWRDGSQDQCARSTRTTEIPPAYSLGDSRFLY